MVARIGAHAVGAHDVGAHALSMRTFLYFKKCYRFSVGAHALFMRTFCVTGRP